MSKLDEEALQELIKAFHDEAAEHLEALNKSLLPLERELERLIDVAKQLEVVSALSKLDGRDGSEKN